MNTPTDVSLNIPSELVEQLSAVIKVGIQRSNSLTTAERQSLSAWWDVEYELIQEDLKNNSGV